MSSTKAAIAALALATTFPAAAQVPTPLLKVSSNGRYLEGGGKPFFWLGDTGWLLLAKLNREQVEQYFAARERQGFTVIQIMVLHKPEMANPLTGPALVDGDVARPRVTPGNDPSNPGEYDYWY